MSDVTIKGFKIDYIDVPILEISAIIDGKEKVISKAFLDKIPDDFIKINKFIYNLIMGEYGSFSTSVFFPATDNKVK